MSTPILIDTDMGIDDAVAIALAAGSRELDLRALVATGGNVPLDQAVVNLRRTLAAISPGRLPRMARGLDQTAPNLQDARRVFGDDGLGDCGLTGEVAAPVGEFLDVYREVLDAHDDLVIIAIGPLTTLADVWRRAPDALRRARRIVVMGGALWCPGNVGPAEFNVYRDPEAAAAVLGSGLPITLVPLDVTKFVTLDEGSAAHLAASGTRAGTFLSQILEFPLTHPSDAGRGRFIVHDALAVGALIWPRLFIATQMGIEVRQSGQERGRTRPQVHGDSSGVLDVLTAVNAVDFLENMMERLCQEEFVV